MPRYEGCDVILNRFSAILLIIIGTFCLSGCASQGNAEESEFHLSKQEREAYEELVDNTLYQLYWRYDADTLSFFRGTVPENTPENEDLFLASEDVGFSMRQDAGKEAVTATVDLLHYNGDKAGRAYFYFTRRNVSGVYYVGGYDDSNHSLNVRNLFLADGKFTEFESDAEIPHEGYTVKNAVFPVDGFIDSGVNSRGQRLIAAVDNGNIIIYRYAQNFARLRTLYCNTGDMVATGVTFLEDGSLAVLIGSVIVEGEGEGQTIYTKSEKVVFYNGSFSKTGEELPLISSEYICVAADGADLVLNDGRILEYYDRPEGQWTKKKQYFLEHGITDFHIVDLDGNGIMEYIMTDGLDLYLYHKTEKGFTRIWSTHLGVASLTGAIYSGDLNKDGIKEIYICDTTGTVIRYVLTPDGLRSRNEGVEYGDRIYPLDYNMDGTDDYVRLNDVEKLECSVYIGIP